MKRETEPAPIQVADDLDLLDLMVDDHERQLNRFSNSGRWDAYSARFLSYLRETGLKDFRRTRARDKQDPARVLHSFGAVDLNVSSSLATSEMMFAAALTSFTGPNAASIRNLEASIIGNPEGFYVEDRFYTLSWLNYYCRYAFASRFFDFDNKTIVEVGPGSGKQAEMIYRAHPSATIILFDLPTQLYVCERYLSKVFEHQDAVVGYRTTRTFEHFQDIQPGKINIVPHWKFDIVKNQEFDLLWNAASFQEMDMDTASSYLDYCSGAKNMYLLHNIKYKPNVEAPGLRGVISEKYLPKHEQVYREWARLAYVPKAWIYFDSFWRRKADRSSEQSDGQPSSGLKRPDPKAQPLTPAKRVRRALGKIRRRFQR